MKVGLDLRCLPSDGSEGAGVAHAARALCSQLIKDKSIDWKAFVVRGSVWQGSHVHELTDGQSKTLRRALKEDPCDILFVPSGAVSLGLDVPAIPWVHDLIIFDHPEWFAQSWLQRQFTTRIFLCGIRRAPVVFAVSEYTKQAIIRHALHHTVHGHAQVSPEKVIVTYEGGDEALRLMQNSKFKIQNSSQEYCRKKFGIERPFVLALGTVEPRKNLAMLIRAWKTASLPRPPKLTLGVAGGRKEGREVFGFDLVIAGRDGWKYDDVTKEIKNLTSSEAIRFHRLENFSDNDKRQLLLAANAVAIPSLDEGFGLVALEALQANTQVIASNHGALPEVIGQAGVLLDPEDETAWIKALTLSPSPTMAGEGSKQAQKFSWEKTAGVVLDGLKRLDKS